MLFADEKLGKNWSEKSTKTCLQYDMPRHLKGDQWFFDFGAYEVLWLLEMAIE